MADYYTSKMAAQTKAQQPYLQKFQSALQQNPRLGVAGSLGYTPPTQSSSTFTTVAPSNASRSQLNVGNGPVYVGPDTSSYKPVIFNGQTKTGTPGSYVELVKGTGNEFVPPVFNTFPYTSNSMKSLFGDGSGGGIDYGSMFGRREGDHGGWRNRHKPREPLNPYAPGIRRQGNFGFLPINGGGESSGPSWTDQLMSMKGRDGKSALQRNYDAMMYETGHSKLPSPATLDVNDPRYKMNSNYYGRPGSMLYNMDGSNTVWVKNQGAGEQRGAPIPQY